MSESSSLWQPLPSLLIRRALSADGLSVQRVVFATLRSFGIEPDPEGIDADIVAFGAIKDDSSLEWVAELAGTPVGSIVITPLSATEAKLSKFFVDAVTRGQGIGRKLLAHVVAESQARGYRCPSRFASLVPMRRLPLPDMLERLPREMLADGERLLQAAVNHALPFLNCEGKGCVGTHEVP